MLDRVILLRLSLAGLRRIEDCLMVVGLYSLLMQILQGFTN